VKRVHLRHGHPVTACGFSLRALTFDALTINSLNHADKETGINIAFV
jgi:hypothetical protein